MEKQEEIFFFEQIEGGLCLVKCKSEDKYITIPSHYNGYKVIDIRVDDFECPYLSELILPNSLQNISHLNLSFRTCLNYIRFPENLKSVGTINFANCYCLKGLVLSDSIKEVDTLIFSNCIQLGYIFARDKSINIKNLIINNCSNLDTIGVSLWHSLPLDVLARVVNIAFNKWEFLSQYEKDSIIDFAENCNKIFRIDCFNAVSIFINENIPLKYSLYNVNLLIDTAIKEENTPITAFLLEYKNNTFTQKEIKEFNEQRDSYKLGFCLPSLEQFQEKWICDIVDGGIEIYRYIGNNITEVIPKTLYDGTIIKKLATNYSNFEHIENLYIKAEIDVIEKYCFSGLTDMIKVVLPSSLKIIEENAFMICDYLEYVEFNSKVDVHKNAFKYCNNVKFYYN